jgi:hypothetical protein
MKPIFSFGLVAFTDELNESNTKPISSSRKIGNNNNNFNNNNILNYLLNINYKYSYILSYQDLMTIYIRV